MRASGMQPDYEWMTIPHSNTQHWGPYFLRGNFHFGANHGYSKAFSHIGRHDDRFENGLRQFTDRRYNIWPSQTRSLGAWIDDTNTEIWNNSRSLATVLREIMARNRCCFDRDTLEAHWREAVERGEGWLTPDDYWPIFALRCLQRHIDPAKTRFQVLAPRIVTAGGNPRHVENFPWPRVTAFRCIGGHSATHKESRPWNLGWETLAWTDVKFLFHATSEDAWRSIVQKGIKRGYRKRNPRKEVFFSSGSYVTNVGPNPHTDIPPYDFRQTDRKQVEIVCDARLVVSTCSINLGEQGAIMTPSDVPAPTIIAVRKISNGEVLWPPNTPVSYTHLTLPTIRSV